MAISTKVGRLAMTGITDMLYFDKATGDLVGEFNTMVNINLQDEQASSELKGGEGNPVLLKIYGDRTTKIDGELATFSKDFMVIATGNTTSVATVAQDVVEKGLVINGTSATLGFTPSASKAMTVFIADAFNRNDTKLTKVASNPTANQYSITGTTITVGAGVTGKLNVYYMTDKEVEQIKAVTGSHPKFRMTARCKFTDIDTGKIYRGNIMSNSVQVSSSYSIAGKNSSDAPDNQKITIDLLTDSSSPFPYEIDLYEIPSGTQQ